MRWTWLGAGALVVASVPASSGCSTSPVPASDESTGTTSQAVQGGTLDDTNKFAVGVCNNRDGTPLDSGSCASLCSGALILPNVVATARHCVDQSPKVISCSENPRFAERKPGTFRITTNTRMTAPGGDWYAVDDANVFVPDDDHICGNDIALLILDEPVPESVAKPVTPGVQYLMWDSAHYEPAFFAIGYGNTSPSGGAGTRRLSTAISVLCVPGADKSACPAAVNPKEFIAADGPCEGDSGSSAFEFKSFNEGAPVSFGVLSRGGESEDHKRCVGSLYTRFDAHRDFVLAVAMTASESWKLYPEPSWTEYKPPPPPKDAGAPDSGTKPKRGLGETCATGGDCSSGICTDDGDGTLLCSMECDEASEASCPDGYQCRENLCLPPAAEPPPTKTTRTTTTGCAASPSSSGTTWGWMALGALAFSALRRRKR
jgi:MYXO-CTERM domain-containing protein